MWAGVMAEAGMDGLSESWEAGTPDTTDFAQAHEIRPVSLSFDLQGLLLQDQPSQVCGRRALVWRRELVTWVGWSAPGKPASDSDPTAKAPVGWRFPVGFQWAGRFRALLTLGSFPKNPLEKLSPSRLCVLVNALKGGERENYLH